MADKRQNRTRRLFQISWILFLSLTIIVFVALKPMPVNFLKYLIWKTATTAHTESGHIENQGAYIHYTSYGKGYPVLLLHGGLSNKLSWFSQIPWLVESGRRVVLIDTRGHGASTHGDSALSYEIFADDTLKVLDKLGIRRTDIVGWSDGGIIGLFLGLEAPDRVNRIVAISANFHPSGLTAEIHKTETGTETRDDQQWRHKILNRLRSFLPAPDEGYADLEKELNKLWRFSPQFKHADLKAISAPTLVIAGENDLIDLPHSGELAQILPYGKIEIVLGAGHAAPVTHANEINELIASFLGIELN